MDRFVTQRPRIVNFVLSEIVRLYSVSQKNRTATINTWHNFVNSQHSPTIFGIDDDKKFLL